MTVSGQGGEAVAPDCPVTPAQGQWVALGPDPYGFELTSDGSHLSGQGCLGALPSEGEALACSPLALQADRGRSVAFVWDMTQSAEPVGSAYVVKMDLTLAPDLTTMAGTVWTSLGGLDGPGQDIVLVRYPVEPLPAATSCSGGEPSGACFAGPLRSDRVDEPRVVELGGGDLLLWWLNQRGVGKRVVSARFDAAAGAWEEAAFLDDGTAPVDAALLSTSPEGWAMVTYRQESAVLTRAYDRKANAWLEQQVVVTGDAMFTPRPEALFVYDGGDATLIASSQNDGISTLSAHDYAGATRAWQSPHTMDPAPNIATYEWAAASDSARNTLVVWVRGGVIGQTHEVWFSSRDAAGAWSEPGSVYTSDKQILSPAVAIGKNGAAIVTWHEFLARIASSSYSFATDAWSEPLTVTTEQDIGNSAVAFDDAGTALAYFHRYGSLSDDADQMTELDDGAWGTPHTVSADAASGATHAVPRTVPSFVVTPLHPRAGESAPPPLERPRCEGY
jgi:hypothetical protein